MARFVKDHNSSVKASTVGGVAIPSGSTAERLGQSFPGDLRFNTDIGLLEFFDGTSYIPLEGPGFAPVGFDQFTGDDVTTDFTISTTIEGDNPARVFVYVGNVPQSPGTYTLSGTTLSFNTAPETGESVFVRYGFDIK